MFNKQNVIVRLVWMQIIVIITVIFFIVDVNGPLFYTFGPNQSSIAPSSSAGFSSDCIFRVITAEHFCHRSGSCCSGLPIGSNKLPDASDCF